MRIKTLFLLAISFIIISCSGNESKVEDQSTDIRNIDFYPGSKPYTRWWWFASRIKKEDVKEQLDWLKENNFGGAEIAWVYPLNRMQRDTLNYTPRQKWLSTDWSAIVNYTKKYADSIGLGLDFTFGTLWPFGDSKVPWEEASMVWGDSTGRQQITASWEYPDKGYVIDHLNKTAFEHYAGRVGSALKPALKGSPSALFADSWEVETRGLWTPGFDTLFMNRFGYDIRPYMDSLYKAGNEGQRYDYFSLLSDLVINRFYRPFTEKCHELGAFSRAQCSGAPCDVLTAYASIDVPEGEAMLYEPSYSRIPASAACLSGKTVVSAESFTCLYGWPAVRQGEEKITDLKMVADALIANGVNQIIWHGMPFNHAGVDTVRFYASVHVGKSGDLAPFLSDFNKYLQKVSEIMKKGRTYTDAALYLPLEDAWRKGVMPKDKQYPWAWGEYELRYLDIPHEVKGYNPIWINDSFLKNAKFSDGKLKINNAEFTVLYVNADYVARESLLDMLNLAKQGLHICIKKRPKEPGFKTSADYIKIVDKLMALKNVSSDFKEAAVNPPLVEAEDMPFYWSRVDDGLCYIFFANPKARKMKYPVGYWQSMTENSVEKDVKVNFAGNGIKMRLDFRPYQSIMVLVNKKGRYKQINIDWVF